MKRIKELAWFVLGVTAGVFVMVRLIEWKLQSVYKGL